jgi:hypothetical protein
MLSVKRVGSIFTAVLALGATSCGKSNQALVNRQWSDSFAYRISVEPIPPRAIEDATYRIVVQDKKTGEPIETGQGRLFANTQGGAGTNDGLAKGKEVGTYYARLRFVTAGDWAIGLQFRRDSTARFERVDWIQSVNN